MRLAHCLAYRQGVGCAYCWDTGLQKVCVLASFNGDK